MQDIQPKQRATPPPPDPAPFVWRHHWPKLVAVGLWLSIALGVFVYIQTNNMTFLAAVRQLVVWLRSPYGLVLFFVLAFFRPLSFFSLSLFIITTGALFGPVWGFIYTLIANLLSATCAYGLGHFLGRDTPMSRNTPGIIRRHTQRLRDHTFETTLILHFLYLPFDLINYLVGMLHVPYRPFLLAVLLGTVPGTFVLVTTGAAIPLDSLLRGEVQPPSLSPWILLFSLSVVVLSICVAHHLRNRATAVDEAASGRSA